MTGILFLLLLGALGYYLTKRDRHRPRSFGTTDSRARSEARGEAGEVEVRGELRRVLALLCGHDFYLHPQPLIVQHAAGTAHPTAEIDHLAVTPFGLFVVETKHWSGHVTLGPDRDTLTRVRADGQREVRQSPDRQSRSKVAFLRNVLPGMWPVESIGVFAGECELDASLPLSLVKTTDLYHYLRTRQREYAGKKLPSVNVHAAWDAVRLVADLRSCALHEHRSKVVPD